MLEYYYQSAFPKKHCEKASEEIRSGYKVDAKENVGRTAQHLRTIFQPEREGDIECPRHKSRKVFLTPP